MKELFSYDLQNYGLQDRIDLAAFIIRLTLGIMYLAHGLYAYVVFTPTGTAAYFVSIGLPGIFAYLTIVAEILAGILLLAGYFSRHIALGMIIVLLGSIVFVHGANGWVFSNANGGWEYPAFMIGISLAMRFLGDGAYSLRLYFYKSN
ncbi:MAG: DoxX family protein [Ectothiorhodospiraceae bacterium]|nr:DoxX family protein [Ectothiorhodospiraceae bacterium]